MMRFLFTLLSLCLSIFAFSQDALNIELLETFHRGDARYSGSWSYVAADGTEYALVGARTGTAVYSLDDPAAGELGFVSGPSSNWREITVVADHAYVTTEGSPGAGMQVIDLRDLPNGISLVTNYTTTFTTGHIIQRDIYSDAPYVYVPGASGTGAVHILDVSNPAEPVEVGRYDPEYYIHDAHIKGDRMYACAGLTGFLDIVDISDKTNPVLLAQISDQTGYVHSAWTTEDDKYLIVAYETDGVPAIIWDIQDLDNIEAVETYSANLASLVHNPYVRGDFSFFSHNTEGLRVMDVADPTLPVEVGYYDTYDGPSGGFFGLWSACPYFPSGKIVGGNRTDGLYVWSFNDTRAARIYGTVVDSLSGVSLADVQVVIEESSTNLTTDAEGAFKKGDLAGTYTLHFSLENYLDKTVVVELAEGENLDLRVELSSNISSIFNPGANAPEILAYPNPAKEMIFLDLKNVKQASQVTFVNVDGQLIKSVAVLANDILKIPSQDLERGVYFFYIKNKIGEVIGKGKVLVD